MHQQLQYAFHMMDIEQLLVYLHVRVMQTCTLNEACLAYLPAYDLLGCGLSHRPTNNSSCYGSAVGGTAVNGPAVNGPAAGGVRKIFR